MAEKQEILFGTGEVFIVNDDSLDIETATDTEIETATTKVGESNGEATLAIEYEFADVRGGAKNALLKSFMTSESVTFNAGVVTYDLKTISEFMAGYFSEDTTTGKRKFGIGGKTTVPIKKLLFVHTKEDGKRIFMMMHKAQNRSGLEWAFNNEENTPFAFEFTLLADTSKQDGNLVTIVEEIEPEVAA
jgi:hypothetical protein